MATSARAIARSSVNIQRKAEDRNHFEWAANQLGIKDTGIDWINIKQSDFVKLSPKSKAILRRYNNSLPKALLSIYPEVNWQLWKFERVPHGFWNDHLNCKSFLHWVSVQMGIKNSDDWLKLTGNDIIRLGGSSLLIKYGNSVSKMIVDLMPNLHIRREDFEKVPHGHWRDVNNQLEFMEGIAKKLNVRSLDDWYKIKYTDLFKLGGHSVLNLNGGSMYNLLKSLYPNHNWMAWKFTSVPSGFWKDLNNQRAFMDWLGRETGLTKDGMEGWYNIRHSHFVKHGGTGLVSSYGGSPSKLLQAVYPEHNWLLWKFHHTPRNFWKEPNNINDYIDWLSKVYRIRSLEDWYRVTFNQVILSGGATLLSRYGSLSKVLLKLFPSYSWNTSQMRKKTKSQEYLYLLIKELFINREVLMDYTHPDCRYSSTNQKMQFDIFIPSLNLAIEYQGIHHYPYTNRPFFFGGYTSYRLKDDEKRRACLENKIKLIEVPYTWNYSKSNLIKQLHESDVRIESL